MVHELFGKSPSTELSSPAAYEEAINNVTDGEMNKHVFVCTDADEFSNLVESYFEARASKLIIHNVTRKQEEFSSFGKQRCDPS